MCALVSILAIISSGCAGKVDLYYWLEPSLTPEQVVDCYTVIERWNNRVGVNGRRSEVVQDPEDANRFIGVRSEEWLTSRLYNGQFAGAAYVIYQKTIVVRSDAKGGTPNFLRRLDHEMGHSLGMLDHLPDGQAGLMDPSATEDFGPNDLAYCQEKGVCQ